MDYYRVVFSIGSYEYSIYRSFDSLISPAIASGVTAKAKNLTESNQVDIQCVGGTTDKLNELSDFITCDRESALGCAK